MFALYLVSGHLVCIYLTHFKDRWTCDSDDLCIPNFKVLSLNTWGMPEKLGSKDKEQRMAAISEELKRGEYDLYLFEELWMRPDYETIKSSH